MGQAPRSKEESPKLPRGYLYSRCVLDEGTVRRLVGEAANGDPAAWDQLVDAFSGLVWSVVRGYGLYGAEAADISQTVWLRFVEHAHRLRQPERAGAWLATTARHECLRVLRRRGRSIAMAEVPEQLDGVKDTDPGTLLAAAEDRALLMAALDEVPLPCQALLRLLITDPPMSYDDISALLDMPKGSIGPTRQRCLNRLRAAMTTLSGGISRERGITGNGAGS
jgi:RNA polymerase sigma factor (sigma-70 family)